MFLKLSDTSTPQVKLLAKFLEASKFSINVCCIDNNAIILLLVS